MAVVLHCPGQLASSVWPMEKKLIGIAGWGNSLIRPHQDIDHDRAAAVIRKSTDNLIEFATLLVFTLSMQRSLIRNRGTGDGLQVR